MYNIVSKLIIYGNMPKDCILMELSSIIREYQESEEQIRDLNAGKVKEHRAMIENKKGEIITRLYHQVKRILVVATDYGFDDNLWHNYLTYLLFLIQSPKDFYFR